MVVGGWERMMWRSGKKIYDLAGFIIMTLTEN